MVYSRVTGGSIDVVSSHIILLFMRSVFYKKRENEQAQNDFHDLFHKLLFDALGIFQPWFFPFGF